MSVAMWDEERFVTLAPMSKLLYCYLLDLSSAAGNIPGLLRGGPRTFAESLHTTYEVVEEGLAEIVASTLIEFDAPKRIVRIPEEPIESRPGNPNVLRGWFRRWREFPESPLKLRHVESIQRAVELTNWARKLKGKDSNVWEETFGSFSTQFEPFRNGSGTVSKPFPNGSQMVLPSLKEKKELKPFGNGLETISKPTYPDPLSGAVIRSRDPEPSKDVGSPNGFETVSDPNALRIAERLFDAVLARAPEHSLRSHAAEPRRGALLATWAAELEAGRASAEHTWPTVEAVVEFSQGSWWAQHVDAPAKLFRFWDKLAGAMNAPSRGESSWHDAGRETKLEDVEWKSAGES